MILSDQGLYESNGNDCKGTVFLSPIPTVPFPNVVNDLSSAKSYINHDLNATITPTPPAFVKPNFKNVSSLQNSNQSIMPQLKIEEQPIIENNIIETEKIQQNDSSTTTTTNSSQTPISDFSSETTPEIEARRNATYEEEVLKHERRRKRKIEKLTPEEKRRLYLERNKKAATKCRQRKKQWMEEMAEKVKILTKENAELIEQLQQLKAESEEYKEFLMAHKQCNCYKIQNYLQENFVEDNRPTYIYESTLINDPTLQPHPKNLQTQNIIFSN